jgi:peptidoglycan/LPS O-acetylase OafA/YrhL
MFGPSTSLEAPGAEVASKRNRLVGLDGLRAFAVSAVVLYHLGAHWLRGGYLGVDLFFVISGFLITTLLIEERDRTGRIGLGAFWLRRGRRLLPALFVMLSFVMAYVLIAGRAGNATVGSLDFANLRGDGIATMLYVANWHLIATSQSYFAQFSAPSPLIHTWSLAIEEQFYLLWPLAVIAMLSARGQRWRRLGATLAGLGAIGSAIEMAVLFHPGVDPSRVYYGTDTRAFDLLIGAAMAFLTVGWVPTPSQRRALRFAGWPCLAFLLLAWVLAGDSVGMPRSFMYRGGFFLCGLAAAVVIAASVFRPDQSLAAALSVRPLVAIGAVSYGVYLWHWPIIVFMNATTLHFGGWKLTAVRLGLITIFTVASYKLVELPVSRRRLSPATRAVVFPLGIAVTVVLVLIGSDPALASPPVSSARHFDSTAALAGVGGIADQTPIALTGPPPSARNPIRVGLFGDSMVYLSAPGLEAALDSTGVVAVSNFSFQGWGTSTIPSWRQEITTAIQDDQSQIIIGTWAWDDHLALTEPVRYLATLHELVSVALDAGAQGVILLGYPKVGPPGSGSTTQARAHTAAGAAAWQRLGLELAREMPGRVMFFPIAPAVELNGKYSTWLPPVGRINAPKQTWQRVRRLDGVHLCIPGIDRWGTALTRDMSLAFKIPPAAPLWTQGSWTSDPVLTEGANECPDDHP